MSVVLIKDVRFYSSDYKSYFEKYIFQLHVFSIESLSGNQRDEIIELFLSLKHLQKYFIITQYYGLHLSKRVNSYLSMGM